MSSGVAPANVIRKHKASLLSLDHHMHKKLIIECADQRVVRGVLKGYDSNMNIILADTVIVHEDSLNPFNPQIVTSSLSSSSSSGSIGGGSAVSHPDVCRVLGAAVIRGSSVLAVYGADGSVLVQTKQSNDPLAL